MTDDQDGGTGGRHGGPPQVPGGGHGGGGRRPAHDGLGGTELAGLGIQFAATILVFLYIGQWLDRRLGTAPWLLIAGVLLGAGASFYSMYRKLMTAQRRDGGGRPR